MTPSHHGIDFNTINQPGNQSIEILIHQKWHLYHIYVVNVII